ncbi:MAG: c-type cytochrome [Alkalilacustris sp.]
MFDTMVFTKALGALCGAALIFLLGNWVANSIFVPGSRNLPPAFVIDTGDGTMDVAEGEEAPAELTLAEAFQMADAGAGARVWNQCRACHVADDTRNNVGPYLQNVMGRDIGAVDGFRYSGALPEGERWTVENMYAFLENPRGWAPGTSMAFNGLSNQMDRMNVIAFLIDNSPDFDPATDAPAIDEAALVEEDEAVEEDVAEVAREEEAIEEEVVEAPAEAAVEEEVVEAPAEDAVEEEVVEAPAEEMREEDMAEASAEEAIEEDMAEAREEDVTEEVAEAPAEEAVEEEVAEAPAEEEAVEEEVAAAPAAEAVEEEVAEAPAEEMSEFAQMVAAGDVTAGARVWNQCRACHVADAEQNRVGPHLVGLVGRQSNSVQGFRYSGNLPDVVWTLDNLNEYLENPRGWAPGTSMAFNGLRNVQDRANVLAYIESLQ